MTQTVYLLQYGCNEHMSIYAHVCIRCSFFWFYQRALNCSNSRRRKDSCCGKGPSPSSPSSLRHAVCIRSECDRVECVCRDLAVTVRSRQPSRRLSPCSLFFLPAPVWVWRGRDSQFWEHPHISDQLEYPNDFWKIFTQLQDLQVFLLAVWVCLCFVTFWGLICTKQSLCFSLTN